MQLFVSAGKGPTELDCRDVGQFLPYAGTCKVPQRNIAKLVLRPPSK
jgi:hypothetical protein